MLKRLKIWWLLIASIGISQVGVASEGKQVHFRTGMVSAVISGMSAQGTGESASNLASSSVLDVEFESFTDYKTSYFFRSMFATDPTTGITRYLVGGMGQKFYLNSIGLNVNSSSGDTTIAMSSGLRYYATYFVGLNQITSPFGPVLTISATMLDLGGGAGIHYNFSKSTSIEGQFNYAYGYSISSLSATAMIMRIGFGVSYLF